MPNPNTNFKTSDGVDLGNKLITKEYLMSVYPQIANQLITPELWVWGDNEYLQLGINFGGGAQSKTCIPVTTFAGGANWKQIASGVNHMAAIKTDGTLWAWGRNSYGQVGDNRTTNSISHPRTPVTTFAGGTNWKQVSCGSNYTAAIKTDGTLWTWGANSFGQLGTNTTTRSNTPVTTFAGGTNWKQVSCGSNYTASIKTDGTLWVWGRNNSGQLGINNTTSPICTPVTTFAGGTNWKQVACGGYSTAAIKTDGTIWTWGTGGYLGTNDITQRLTPVTTFAGGTNWKQVSCGSNYTAAIKTDGTLWTWGANSFGQLGTNTTTRSNTPVTTFAGGTNWKQVSCGSNYTASIKTDGTLWVWGRNNSGQLGINNTTSPICTPVTTFAGGTNWKQVACGGYSTAAIKTDGTLWTWGRNFLGELGINDAGGLTGRSTPITTFAGGTNWKQVSGGSSSGHAAAIKTSDDLTGI